MSTYTLTLMHDAIFSALDLVALTFIQTFAILNHLNPTFLQKNVKIQLVSFSFLNSTFNYLWR